MEALVDENNADRLTYLDFGKVPELAQRTKVRWASSSGQPMDLQLFLPVGWQPQGPRWPLLVFLHGAGDGVWEVMNSQSLPRLLSHDQSTEFDRAKTWEFQFDGKTLSNATFADSFRFVVVMPQGWRTFSRSGWDRDRLVQVQELVSATIGAYHVDPDRVSLTGQSVGGVGAWAYAMHAPETWAAVVPVCGASPVSAAVAARKLTGMPVWVFHSEDDSAMPVGLSDAMVGALRDDRRRANDAAPVKYTRYRTAPPPPDPKYSDMFGHASYDLAYRDAALYTWLLERRRGEFPPRRLGIDYFLSKEEA